MHSSDIHSHNFHDVNVQSVPKVFTRMPVGIEILTALTVNCVVTPCGPVDIYRRVRGTYCLHLQGTSVKQNVRRFYIYWFAQDECPSFTSPYMSPCTENGSNMCLQNVDKAYETTRIQVPANIILSF
jgi:hypothetical protein